MRAGKREAMVCLNRSTVEICVEGLSNATFVRRIVRPDRSVVLLAVCETQNRGDDGDSRNCA